MKFSAPSLEEEFKEALEDEVRRVVEALDFWSRENHFPEVTVTEVRRTRDRQEQIYSRYALGLRVKLREGQLMSAEEKALAIELMKLSLPELSDWARRRFSWHLVDQAVDIRSRHYSAPQLKAVREFLAKRCPKRLLGEPKDKPDWELLMHDIHGMHIHIALRNAAKRKDVQ